MMPLTVPAFAELGAEIDHGVIKSGTSDRIDITFTQYLEQYGDIEYIIHITKDGRDVFGPTNLLFAPEGIAGIETRFDEAGTYVMSVMIKGAMYGHVFEEVIFEIPVYEGNADSKPDKIDEMRKNRIAQSFMRLNEGYNDGLVYTEWRTTYMMVAGDKTLQLIYDNDGLLLGKAYSCINLMEDTSFSKMLVKMMKLGCPSGDLEYDRALKSIRDTKIVKIFKEAYPDYEEDLYKHTHSYEYNIEVDGAHLEIIYHSELGVRERILFCERYDSIETHDRKMARRIKECADPTRHPIILDRQVYPVPFASMKYHDLARGDIAGDTVIHAWYDGTSDVTAKITRGVESVPVGVSRSGNAASVVVSHDMGLAAGCPTDGRCILAGDVITISAGESTTSVPFGLTDGYVTLNQMTYLRGSDMIIAMYDPDLDLDARQVESYSLDMLGWRSEIADISMGPLGGHDVFNPEPDMLVETGEHTGMFQVVAAVPPEIGGRVLDPGSPIKIEYMDRGPAGASFVGEYSTTHAEDMYTANFGVTIELDQKRYTWTDEVYIMVIAPDYNINQDEMDAIGTDGRLRMYTTSDAVDLVLHETGRDTGIFAGSVLLAGFPYNADGNHLTGNHAGHDVWQDSADTLRTDNNDEIMAIFNIFSGDSVTERAQVMWNTGEVEWIQESYMPGTAGIARIIDPDMNWDPNRIDSFEITVYSDSDGAETKVMVREIYDSAGIFTAVVQFADTPQEGYLHAVLGDTITIMYDDHTLPAPYGVDDSQKIYGSALIGSPAPPK